jgi:hypothetical protein
VTHAAGHGPRPALPLQAGRARVAVPFTGAGAGTGPLSWGQKAIHLDMQDNLHQFSMGGRAALAPGSTVADAAALLSGVMSRHASLRMRLRTDPAGRPCQEIAGSGQAGLDVLTVPDDTDPAGAERYAAQLTGAWPLVPFDFQRDWPLRMAVLQHRGACVHVVWALSHLAADGGGHVLLLDDLLAHELARHPAAGPPRVQLPAVARSEQEPQLRQVSSRAMRYWESQLRGIPPLTFGAPAAPQDRAGPRYRRVRFSSPAAHLAMLAIAQRTRADASRVTLAVIATAIGRAAGVAPLTVNVMVNNRFRPGLADVIAPVAQNSVLTIDVRDSSIDEAVARARGAALTAGMRAYYDPDELRELKARLDTARGYPARVSCRVNDQRAMVNRDDGETSPGEVTPEQVCQLLPRTSMESLEPLDHLHDQAVILVENQREVLSVVLMYDSWSLPDALAGAFLRGMEEAAVEAAFDPAAPTRVRPGAVPRPAPA